MTRVEMEQRLQNNFNNAVYYDHQAVRDSLQDGIDEVCAFSGCIYKAARIPFQQNRTYYDLLTLLPDYIGVVAMYNETIHRWMFPTSLKKLEEQRVDWDTVGGTPYFFVPVNHRYVAIWYKPLAANYGNLILYYRAAAPTLVDETPIPIPDEFQTALEFYSIVDLWEQAQEWGKATEAFDDYLKNLDGLRTWVRNKRNSDRVPSLK